MKNKKVITSWWKPQGILTLLEYKEKGGFSQLESILDGSKSPQDIINTIKESGLQGRGGGGFPVGTKWQYALDAVKKAKPAQFPAESESYFICNADESEPGTYKDKMIIEKNPYSLLEAIIIGSWVIGASKAIIYINGHYKGTYEILKKVIDELEENKILGEKILGSDYSLDIEIFQGAGSYVCGEETALINSIESGRGEPKLRPPYPVTCGLFERPTVVNNVESLSYIPYILKHGAKSFKKLGESSTSYGTKMFVLNDPVKAPGVYELPLGITINELLNDHAGGLVQSKKLKCVQVGGSSGMIYVKESWDKPIGYCEKQIPVGSGAVLFIDESVDIKKLLLAWSSFFLRESCGKCSPCREGNYQLTRIAEKLINKGKIDKKEKAKIKDLIFTIQRTSFCPLGTTSINGWQSLISLFPDEIFE